jgi:hypothetical protein
MTNVIAADPRNGFGCLSGTVDRSDRSGQSPFQYSYFMNIVLAVQLWLAGRDSIPGLYVSLRRASG